MCVAYHNELSWNVDWKFSDVLSEQSIELIDSNQDYDAHQTSHNGGSVHFSGEYQLQISPHALYGRKYGPLMYSL